MKRFLDKLSYAMLIPMAVLLGLSPFTPQPHAVEKIRMLASGTLQRPLDIFDLVMHLAPLILLLAKGLADIFSRREAKSQ